VSRPIPPRLYADVAQLLAGIPAAPEPRTTQSAPVA